MMSLTNEVTIAPNATPMITPRSVRKLLSLCARTESAASENAFLNCCQDLDSPASDGAMPSRLLAPGTSERFTLTLSIPAALPAGDYRGAMLLQGFRSNSIAVVVTVEDESSNSGKFVAKAKQKAAHAGATKTAKKAAKKSTTKTTKKATKRAGKKPFGTRRGA